MVMMFRNSVTLPWFTASKHQLLLTLVFPLHPVQKFFERSCHVEHLLPSESKPSPQNTYVTRESKTTPQNYSNFSFYEDIEVLNKRLQQRLNQGRFFDALPMFVNMEIQNRADSRTFLIMLKHFHSRNSNTKCSEFLDKIFSCIKSKEEMISFLHRCSDLEQQMIVNRCCTTSQMQNLLRLITDTK